MFFERMPKNSANIKTSQKFQVIYMKALYIYDNIKSIILKRDIFLKNL